ncbi:MAG: DUF2378 family protein [Myxococcota bacterium]
MPCELKGQGFRGLLDMFKQQHGDAKFEQLAASLGGPLGELVRGRALLAAGWYPMPWYAQLHEAIAQLAPGSARTLGKAAAREDVNTVFRFVLSLASPARLASLGTRIFSTFLRGATVTLDSRADRLIHITFDGCEGANRGVWDDIEGSIEAFVELSGATGCRVRCVESQGARAVFEITWG